MQILSPNADCVDFALGPVSELVMREMRLRLQISRNSKETYQA